MNAQPQDLKDELMRTDEEFHNLAARHHELEDRLHELTAKHSQIRIGLFAVRDVAVCVLVVIIGRSMKGIAGGVHTHESKSAVDGIKKRLFSLRRHGRVLVRSDGGQVASGKEQYCGMLTKIFGVENSAVFGRGHIEAVLLP